MASVTESAGSSLDTGEAADEFAPAAGPPAADREHLVAAPPNPLACLAAAAVAGAALALTARSGAVPLLVAIGILQAALAVAWVWGTGVPGRSGALVAAAFAAAGADVTASVWPHGRLGAQLAVLGLAVAVLFVHQLARGAARAEIVSSMSATSLLVLAEVGLGCYLQLWHEFGSSLSAASAAAAGSLSSAGPSAAGRVVAAAAGALAAALVAAQLVDMVAPVPRFDPEVPRGLLAVLAAGVVGAAIAFLVLRHDAGFPHGRSVFLGAGVGALAGLIAVGTAFVLHTADRPAPAGRALRPVVAGMMPIAVLAPVAFLVCLSVRR